MASSSLPFSSSTTTMAPLPAPASFSTAGSGLISPPGSRRTSGDEPTNAAPPPVTRQSLPSISEALGSNPLRRHLPPAFPQPIGLSAAEPTMLLPRTLPGPETGRFHLSPTSQSMERSSSAAQAPSQAPLSVRSPTIASAQASASFGPPHLPKLPTLQPSASVATPVSNLRTTLSYPSQSSTYETQPVPAPAPSPYHFSSAPSNHQYVAPPTVAGSSSVYPSPTHSLPPQYNPGWRAGDDKDGPAQYGKPHVPAYGDVIKRQLDIFDLEGSLNEIADCSGKLLDFSRLYGDRAHQTQRSGPTLGSIPDIADLEELLLKSARIRDALHRIKDVVATQNATFKDQRHIVPNGHAQGHGTLDQGAVQPDEAKQGGFAGSDPKKRRGRAAPPGRCHSCNRAETPEWRRGPDGARTLCNACGLHYAKLTRKMGGNKASLANSNLRPKAPGSPNST